MRILNETYLDQMCEELEILDFELDRLWEAATGTSANESYNEDSLDGISLLEDVEPEIQILNEEAYDLYVESLTDSLKKIWSAIVRFVKSIFTSTGKTLSTEDIKKTVEIISSASADGVQKGSVKKVIQNGFYIIAGLGTSVDGQKLRDAYESGDIMNFVYQNIGRVKTGNLISDARFRICIGSYSDAAKVNTQIIKSTLETLKKGGVDAVKAMGKKSKDWQPSNESYELDNYDLDTFLESVEYMTEATAREQFINVYGDDPELLAIYDKMKAAKPNSKQHDKAFRELEAKIKEKGKGHGDYDGQSRQDSKKAADAQSDEESKLKAYAKRDNASFMDAEKRIMSLATKDPEKALRLAKVIGSQNAKAMAEKELDKHKGMISQISDTKTELYNSQRRSAVELERASKSASLKGAAIGAGAAVGAAALAGGIMWIVDHAKGGSSSGGKGEPLSLATITYVNESQPNAIAKVRLYTRRGVTNIDLNGRDKVFGLRDDLTSIAKEMEMNGDKFSPGMKEKIREFAMNINLFFAGMVEKPSKG